MVLIVVVHLSLMHQVHLSGYSKVVVDAEPSIADYDLCISVLDATKKDEWNAELAQGIKYGASFPGELALADIKAGEIKDSEGNIGYRRRLQQYYWCFNLQWRFR